MKIQWDNGTIYRITNTITNKVYIGSTILEFKRRKSSHICHLRRNRHHSKRLQNSWNKHGEENFIFEIVEMCEKIKVVEREQYWMDYYDSYNKGYNASPIAGNCEGRPVKESTRLKISTSLRGRTVNRTTEHNKKLAIAKYKPVIQYDENNNIINRFISAASAAISLSVKPAIVSAHCLGTIKNNKFNIRYE